MSKITGTSIPIVRPTATGQTADTGKVQDSVNPGVPTNQPITPSTSPYSEKTKANLKAEFAITGNLIRSDLERQLSGMQSAAPLNTDSVSEVSVENRASSASAMLNDINATYNDMAEGIEKEYQNLIREAKNQVRPDDDTKTSTNERPPKR